MPKAPALEPGARLGRFAIVRLLGAGGMGAVYEAHDPDLDRRVALKLLKSPDDADGSVRLLREAQALAQLAHANVVAVHEVAADGDGVYIVMELVDGRTLGDELAARPRGWHEILGLFVQAGRGLAAAHARSIIHRDFKPGNVLVDAHGRARVTDFGLARVDSEVSAPVVAAAATLDDVRSSSTVDDRDTVALAPRTPSSRLLDAQLTVAGTLIGTPRYMAPEQSARGVATARSDQYAFCVALWEALHGELPPLRARRVPRWLARALETGLATRPAERHASMAKLLDVLERTPLLRRRLATVAVGVFLAGASAAAAAALVVRPRAADCDPQTARARMAPLWDDAARGKVRAAFLATARPQAEGVFGRVDRAMTSTVDAWAQASTAACRATRHGEQSQVMLDLRMSCLERARRRVAALVEVWAGGAADLDGAVDAATAAVDLAACADTDALAAVVPLPGDPATRREVEALRGELDELHALRLAAKVGAAAQRMPAVVERARAAAHAPTLAEALWTQGWLEREAGRTAAAIPIVESALRAAGEGRDDRRIAHVLRTLIFWIGNDNQRFDSARALFAPAEAAVARAGADDKLRASLLRIQAAVLQQHGDYAEAARRAGEALALIDRAPSDDHERDRAAYLHTLAGARRSLGELDEALALYERARAAYERSVGPEHPNTTRAMSEIARILSRRGEHARAEELSRQVLAIRERVYPPAHPHIADALTQLAAVIGRRAPKDLEVGTLLRRALEIREQAYGPEHGLVAETLGNLAKVETELGRHDVARDLFARAIAVSEKVHGPTHPQLAGQLVGLGGAQRRAGDPAAAKQTYARAVAIYQKLPGLDPEHIQALQQLGVLAATGGRPADAVPYFTQALALSEKLYGANHQEQIELRANLEQARREAGRLSRGGP